MNSLFPNIFSLNNLTLAWQLVKQRGSKGGVDKQSLEMFEQGLHKNLTTLSNELRYDKYEPQPYLEIQIPKKENEKRTLGLPVIRDKIVQQAVKIIIEPVVDKRFLGCSYGYRPNRGALKAISRVRHMIVNEKRDWVTIADIDNFFDSINHALLLEKFRQMIDDARIEKLISLWIRMGRVTPGMQWRPSEKGIPQGGVISPILANVYLHSFDQYFSSKQYGLVRYADDFIVLSTLEGDAYRALQEINLYVPLLKLKLNEGAAVEKINTGFEFLGVWFRDKSLSVSERKTNELFDRITQKAKFTHLGMHKGFFEQLQGIKIYYARFLDQSILETWDQKLAGIIISAARNARELNILRNRNQLITALKEFSFLSVKFINDYNHQLEQLLASSFTDVAKNEVRQSSQKDVVWKRQKEYEKLETRHREIIVSKPGVFLGITNRGIVVKEKGIKISEISHLALKNITILSLGVSLSSNLIRHCAEHNVPIDFHDFNGKPYARLFTPVSLDTDIGLAQLEAATNSKGARLSCWIVKGKISNQVNLLKYLSKYRKQNDPEYHMACSAAEKAIGSISNEISKLETGDLEKLRGQLFSIEGRAAREYWDVVKILLRKNIHFGGRERKGASDLVNSMLNYGYAILYARIWNALTMQRLNPHISYLHKSQTGKPSLAYDIIEQFRQQAVDRVVFSLITKGELLQMKDGLLDENTRKRLAEKVLERLNTVEKFRRKEMRLTEIIHHQCAALKNYLIGNSSIYKPYIAKW